MNYKLVVVDLDDSLLNCVSQISEGNQRAIKKARDKGVMVTIATGRIFSSALPFAKQLGINIPIISCQGATIIHPITGEKLHSRPVSMELTRQILKFALDRDLYIQVSYDNNYYYSKECQWQDKYYSQTKIRGVYCSDLMAFVNDPPAKLLIIDEQHNISKLWEEAVAVFGDSLAITISCPEYLEFNHWEATKGNGVKALMNMLGIPREQVIAIGDSFNDISMLEVAGLGVAVANAPDDVKAHADFITLPHYNDGVAHVIEKFILS
ncbi:MAG TPA: HAD family phosphatase [Clostridiales bacterium]|nr:HAD family phosphatase [Clostridiales bacterium]